MLLQTPPVAAMAHSGPLQALSAQPTAVPLLWTARSALRFRPCQYQQTHASGRGARGGSAPVCADVSPAGREWGLCSPLSLPFCPCCCEGASQDAGTAPLFSSLPGVHVPPLHPLFFSFLLPDRDFSCPFRCLRSPACVQ